MRILCPLVPLYYLISESRRLLYQKGILKKVSVPALVISVGNITVGGTGKTTVTQYLAGRFREKGKRVAVISHGVSGNRKGLIVSDGRSILVGVRQAGDEAYLLARNLPGVPVLSGRQRTSQAQAACDKFAAEVIILDDAFHVLKLLRDYDILVFNCFSGLGGCLLPAGPLREPLANLRRAQIFWLNQTDLVDRKELDGFQERLLGFNPKASVVKSYYRYRKFRSLSGEEIPPEGLAGKKVWLCAGIGDPQAFARKMEGLDVKVLGRTFFPDHHFYSLRDLERIPLKEVDFLVTTEKDSVRFPEAEFPRPVLYPEIELNVEGLSLC